MRVLVTGASGQLGTDFVTHCRSLGDHVIALDRVDLDIGDRGAVLEVVRGHRPEVVVNAAAWTQVDACESDAERAFRDNALSVGWLREGSDEVGAHLVQISTDYVFDGTLDRPYREDDRPNPSSVYGASKLEGERLAGERSTIVRTSWVCGATGNNIVKTVLRLLDAGQDLAFVDDQRGCPTFTADLAPAIRALAIARRRGVFHVTNQRAVSWYEFVCDVVLLAGEDPGRVRPISTGELSPPRPAPRPANSVLDNAAIVAAGMPLLRDYRYPLAELLAELRA